MGRRLSRDFCRGKFVFAAHLCNNNWVWARYTIKKRPVEHILHNGHSGWEWRFWKVAEATGTLIRKPVKSNISCNIVKSKEKLHYSHNPCVCWGKAIWLKETKDGDSRDMASIPRSVTNRSTSSTIKVNLCELWVYYRGKIREPEHTNWSLTSSRSLKPKTSLLNSSLRDGLWFQVFCSSFARKW